MSGFGRCSLTVEIPIISKLGIQCCPIPTAILSNHTMFESFTFHDCTDMMEAYAAEWKKIGLEFEGILTGFLGSVQQIEIVEHIIADFRSDRTKVIIDPVMGDGGKTYRTYTPEMCDGVSHLVRYADVLTPNLTEACILTKTPYREKFTEKELCELARQLCALGPEKVVVTGVSRGEFLENYCYEASGKTTVIRAKRVAPQRSGTGDVFAAIVASGEVKNIQFEKSVRTAATFIRRCLKRSAELEIPPSDGVCFEEVINQLRFPLEKEMVETNGNII